MKTASWGNSMSKGTSDYISCLNYILVVQEETDSLTESLKIHLQNIIELNHSIRYLTIFRPKQEKENPAYFISPLIDSLLNKGVQVEMMEYSGEKENPTIDDFLFDWFHQRDYSMFDYYCFQEVSQVPSTHHFDTEMIQDYLDYYTHASEHNIGFLTFPLFFSKETIEKIYQWFQMELYELNISLEKISQMTKIEINPVQWSTFQPFTSIKICLVVIVKPETQQEIETFLHSLSLSTDENKNVFYTFDIYYHKKNIQLKYISIDGFEMKHVNSVLINSLRLDPIRIQEKIEKWTGR